MWPRGSRPLARFSRPASSARSGLPSTKVTILLPRQEIGSLADRTSVTEIGGSGTVLLVEDNPEVALVSISLLEQLGYTVRRVPDAETALREIAYDDIDLVFSDIVMPGK